MNKFETQHWTPTSTETSAYGWDRLVDGIFGSVGDKTTQSNLDEALSRLTDADVARLHTIFMNLPARGLEHLARAIAREHGRRAR